MADVIGDLARARTGVEARQIISDWVRSPAAEVAYLAFGILISEQEQSLRRALRSGKLGSPQSI
jgi:hypothetical protein